MGNNGQQHNLHDLDGGGEACGDASHLVTLLVGIEHYHPEIDEIAQQGVEEKYTERGIGIPKRHLDAAEYLWKEAQQHGSAERHHACHAPVYPSLQGNNLIDGSVITIKERFVEEIRHRHAHSALHDVEEAEQVAHGTFQSHDLGAQVVEEYLTAPETENHEHHVVEE